MGIVRCGFAAQYRTALDWTGLKRSEGAVRMDTDQDRRDCFFRDLG
jgi:hypothetical protein